MSEKTNLIPKRRFKEFENDLPWEQRKVSDVLELLTDYDANGSFADMAENVNTYDSDGYAWYVRMTDLKSQNELSAFKYVDKESYDFLKKTELHGGELLMAKRGEIGNVYIFKAKTPFATLAPNMYLLKLNKETVPEFMYGFFQADIGKNQLLKLNASTTMGALYKDDVKNIDVKIPSLEEQSKIAEYFSSLDHLITLHQRKLDKLKATKSAYLSEMFATENNRKPKIRFSGFTEDWEQRKLGELSTSFEYGLNAAAKEFDGENKYIRITDIDDNTREFLKSDLTSPDISLDNAENYQLKDGDIVFARTGASVGKTYIYKESDGLVYYAGFLIRARIKPEYSAEFIFQNTLTKNYEKFIRITSQRSGQPGVNAQEYGNFDIFVPKYEEQKKIGEYFQYLDNLITLHQRKLDKLKNIKKAYLNEMFV